MGRAGRNTGRRLDPLLAGGLDEPKAVVEAVKHLSDQVKVGRRTSHSPPMVSPFGERLTLPPSKAVISTLLLSLKHFSFTGGMR